MNSQGTGYVAIRTEQPFFLLKGLPRSTLMVLEDRMLNKMPCFLPLQRRKELFVTSDVQSNSHCVIFLPLPEGTAQWPWPSRLPLYSAPRGVRVLLRHCGDISSREVPGNYPSFAVSPGGKREGTHAVGAVTAGGTVRLRPVSTWLGIEAQE